MIRKVIHIDEEKCDGCGLCIPECKENAIAIIEGKAKLVDDIYCDGLGACIGNCPLDAISIEEREAKPYNEMKVLDSILKNNPIYLNEHLNHLKEHNKNEYYNQAFEYLSLKGINVMKKKNINNTQIEDALIYKHKEDMQQGCPGMRVINSQNVKEGERKSNSPVRNKSYLRQWPVQLHLVPPNAPFFQNSELVIMNTCGPVASANIHKDYLDGRSVVIACPKLDYTEPYKDKLSNIYKMSNIKKVIVVIMEVPCCRGLSKIAVDAASQVDNHIEITEHILMLDGNLKQEVVIF